MDKPLNEYIDHTLLTPDATHEEFETFLDEAVKYQFAAVCVSPHMALPVKAALTGERIKVCTVVGFPHGNIPRDLKVSQIEYFARGNVDEIDFVLNYGDLKSGRGDDVGNEVEVLGKVCAELGVTSKCIIETCYLTEDEKNFVFKAINEYTLIDYIKTSTGFGTDGASLGDVLNWNALRLQTTPLIKNDLIQLTSVHKVTRSTPLKIKAAGGIRDLDTALRFIAAGADRLGMSASVKVMEDYNTP